MPLPYWKALGGCLARQVLVFNCDEAFDLKSMGRIFTGLVKCGAWGRLDVPKQRGDTSEQSLIRGSAMHSQHRVACEKGFIKQEEIPLKDYLSTINGSLYLGVEDDDEGDE